LFKQPTFSQDVMQSKLHSQENILNIVPAGFKDGCPSCHG